MKLIRIFVFVFGLWLNVSFTWCQTCPVTVQADIFIENTEVRLADLLAPDSCPLATQAARQIHLGAAPLEGSIRVFDRVELRGLFQKLQSNLGFDSYRLVFARVPERVVIHRAHGQSSCQEIKAQILASPEISNLHSPGIELDCEAATRVPHAASLALTRKNWDHALQSWDFVARCTRAGECLPFLVRVRSSSPTAASYGLSGELAIETMSAHGVLPDTLENILVRPGDRASVVWDQGGIRLTVPAVCLDKGRRGDSVRARFEHGGVIRAIVIDSKSLRVQS
jgi:hypothetical protein